MCSMAKIENGSKRPKVLTAIRLLLVFIGLSSLVMACSAMGGGAQNDALSNQQPLPAPITNGSSNGDTSDNTIRYGDSSLPSDRVVIKNATLILTVDSPSKIIVQVTQLA